MYKDKILTDPESYNCALPVIKLDWHRFLFTLTAKEPTIGS